MSVRSVSHYREKMDAWKEDVMQLYQMAHNGSGIRTTEETLEKIDEVSRRIRLLAIEACDSACQWIVGPEHLTDVYFGTLHCVKGRYDYILKFYERRRIRN